MVRGITKWIPVATVLACVVVLLLLQRDPAIRAVDLSQRFHPPSTTDWFGTDELGRDVFKRTLAGAGYTSALVLISLLGATLIGIAFGVWAGFSERMSVKWLHDQLVNIVWSLPGLVLFIVVMTYFGRDFITIAATMSAVAWAPIARVMRIEVEREKRKDYAETLRTFGFGKRQVIRRLLANLKLPLYVVILTVALDLIAAESGLSFLGLGIQPPAPSLGAMIYNGLVYQAVAWWMLVFPLVALLLLIFLLRLLLPRKRSISS